MSVLPAFLDSVPILPWMATSTNSLFVLYSFIQEDNNFFLRVLFTVQNKVISTEFQPVNSVHSQWKWHTNWTLWWINNEPHWNHLYCSPQSGICIITSLGSIFDNLLPQRNQIDWRGSHYCQVTHIQLVLSIAQKAMWFAQIWNSLSLPGSRIPALNAWNNENANLELISQMKFKP